MSKNNKKHTLKSKFMAFLNMVLGGTAGFVGGMFGGGGGMLIVPTLTSVDKVETRVAHATAILAVLPLTIASSVIFGVKGYFDQNVIIFTMIGSVIGGIIGAKLLRKLSNQSLSFFFYVVMIVAGAQMLV